MTQLAYYIFVFMILFDQILQEGDNSSLLFLYDLLLNDLNIIDSLFQILYNLKGILWVSSIKVLYKLYSMNAIRCLNASKDRLNKQSSKN